MVEYWISNITMDVDNPFIFKIYFITKSLKSALQDYNANGVFLLNNYFF